MIIIMAEAKGKRICVHGNIGAGKSTFIAEHYNTDFIKLPEPIERWEITEEDIAINSI